ncbi:DNA helicase [Tanacetum coccineum]|uniref:ATP-dependent DNA helicase n=1 Tax=Tanacetum coccineum TaxID=301880 RepID=A0ABQ5FED5_9ASTR
MKGKRKCEDLDKGHRLGNGDVFGNEEWNGGLGSTSGRQRSRRAFLCNRPGFGSASEVSDTDVGNMASYTSGCADGGILLDFEQTSMQALSNRQRDLAEDTQSRTRRSCTRVGNVVGSRVTPVRPCLNSPHTVGHMTAQVGNSLRSSIAHRVPDLGNILGSKCRSTNARRRSADIRMMTYNSSSVPQSDGEVYHWIGSLCPSEGDPPRFLQLYIYDTENEVTNRLRHFGGDRSGNLDQAIVEGLIGFLDKHNELVRLFLIAKDNHYLDALTICQTLGNPQFFITFTCNVNWPEIKRHMQRYPELLPGDRADVVVRVFHQKVEQFCMFLRSSRLFGTVTGLLYTIEFQKRGLPHCHTLLWIDDKEKIQHAEDIDNYISADLPDPNEDPEGYRVVSEMMIHGPCGPPEPNAPCMKENRCSKKFPKAYNATTYFDKDGYAHYRRRETNVYTTRRGVDLDNYYTGTEQKHGKITRHVEYCGWTMLIKYLFKYISKGTDRIVAKITRPIGEAAPQVNRGAIHVDEIQNFVDGRYICPYEAEYNKYHTDGRHLTYLDFPKSFVWYGDSKKWNPRQRSGQVSIGRLAHVHPSAGELFYLRIILCHQKCCMSFEDIRTVNGRVYSTFRAACEAFGLLDFGLPTLSRRLLEELRNRELLEERSYDRDKLAQEVAMLTRTDICIRAWRETRRRSVEKTISNTLRSQGKIVLAVASSGIASLLLPSGRTAHSRFKLPLELTDESICKIAKNTHVGRLLAETNLIIWDESPMNDRRCFETLDRTLRDIMDTPETLFGRKTIVLGGDFRQTLSVKKGATKHEIVASSIAESYLWKHFKVYPLEKTCVYCNNRLTNRNKPWHAHSPHGFSTLAMAILGTMMSKTVSFFWISIPEAYCIPDDNNGLSNLINFIYDKNTLQHPTAQELQQKAIVCPRNDTADIINTKVLSMVYGDSTTYKSSDEAIPLANDRGAAELLYPMEYLNTLNFSGFPPHELELKVGIPIMLLRNVNLQGGMCNGTRMIVKKLWSKLIEAQVITGNRVGEKVYIPRIILTTKDPNMSFTFKRKQFPIKVCYAMTINKSQGQSLKKIGVFLPEPVFGHGQLYVALSRATSPHGLRILIKQQQNQAANATKNIVYKDFLSNIHSQQGNAIQASMGTGDIQYFSSLLKAGSSYRITNFTCTPTIKYQQTLDTQTSLKFGRYTKFDSIPSDDFPKHYFNFVAYNQLEYKFNRESTTIDQNQVTLTDYIGCLTRVGDVERHGRPGANQTVLRKLDIENLDGDVIELTIWDEIAENFHKAEYELMQKPVIIAVSSCKVTEYANTLQLTATSATFYYLNPEIPELDHLLAEFTAKYDLKPLLEISKSKFADPEREKKRNRYPISTLLQENPDSYKGVRFTAEATITGINTSRDWYYIACAKCIRKVLDGTDIPTCPDHGPQPHPNYRYNFKAFIADHSATATFTFFTPNANVLTHADCPELVKKYNIPSMRDFPEEILALEGKQHVFQFHYNPYCQTGRVDFYFDDILDKPLQITDSEKGKSQVTGESSNIIEGTTALETPDTHIPGTPAKRTPTQIIPLLSPPSVTKPTISSPLQQTAGIPIPAVPVQQITSTSVFSKVTPTATTTLQQPTEPVTSTTTDDVVSSPGMSEVEHQVTMANPTEPKKITTDQANTAKRELFRTDSQEYKKPKTD